ncbi:MAG TPA: malectin domain-containing carbohydrate-binding protein [Marmoricola sp.]|nr:malectin domain-containing carbohydrate-binding protein [Marmoricola sp.]
MTSHPARAGRTRLVFRRRNGAAVRATPLRWRSWLAVLGLAMAPLVATAPAAQTENLPPQRVVSSDPADFTPHVMDGRVNAIAQSGDVTLVGGAFTEVREHGQRRILPRSNLFAFDARTGEIIDSFTPSVGGTVSALQATPDGTGIYVAGDFAAVDGEAAPGLALLDIADGGLRTSFRPPRIDGAVEDIRLVGERLYVAGRFGSLGQDSRTAIAALGAVSGALDRSFDLKVEGAHGRSPWVRKIDVSPDASRLVMIGDFNTVAGRARRQVAVIDLEGPHAAPAPWRTNFFAGACSIKYNTYVRDVDIAPNGRYFVVTTTGGYRGSDSPCDVATRWELTVQGSDLDPTWRDYTGGDTLLAVEVTPAAVYIGGHFEYLNNPFTGRDDAGRGAVPRSGIAALDPVNGLPLSWNPGRTRGVGVFDLLATSSGLWTGSDTRRLGGEYHARLGFFPFDGGTTVDPVVTGSLPGDVYVAGRPPVTLYRVNAGGGRRAAPDGLSWQRDSNRFPSARHNRATRVEAVDPVRRVDASVPVGTPAQLFRTARRDPARRPPMRWDFPVPAGSRVAIRLYFAEGAHGPGDRVFNVAIEGRTRLNRVDIARQVGRRTGTVRSVNVTSDGNIDIDFLRVRGQPMVSAIEVIGMPAGGERHQLLRRPFDGSAAASSEPVDLGVRWGVVRGGFMLGGTLFTGTTAGALTARSFDGRSIGEPRSLDLHGLTSFAAEVRRMTGLFYSDGRLYYTLAGEDSLFYRYFTPESEVVGAQRFVAAGNSTDVAWGRTAGMFLSGNELYVASVLDGTLRRVAWRSGRAADPVVVVSGPAIDGVDWRARALVLIPADRS